MWSRQAGRKTPVDNPMALIRIWSSGSILPYASLFMLPIKLLYWSFVKLTHISSRPYNWSRLRSWSSTLFLTNVFRFLHSHCSFHRRSFTSGTFNLAFFKDTPIWSRHVGRGVSPHVFIHICPVTFVLGAWRRGSFKYWS